jgi:hypothetical protein
MLEKFMKAKKFPRLVNLAYRDMPHHPGDKLRNTSQKENQD